MLYSLLLNINIAIKSRLKVIKLWHNEEIGNQCNQHDMSKLSENQKL